jgi:putative peptidoglycan lipid II flippase
VSRWHLPLKLALLAGSNILLTFAYQWYVLTRIGPGASTDALFAGMMVPQLILGIVSTSLTQVMVPILSVVEDERLSGVAWTIFQGLALLFSGLTIILITAAPLWVPLTVPGFDDATTALAVRLTRIQLWSIVCLVLVGVQSSAYQARGQFLRPEASPVLGSIVGFGYLLWALPRQGVVAVAWATVLRSVLQVFLLLPSLGRYHVPQWRDPAVGEAWHRIRPLLTGSLYFKSDVFLDRFLASMAPPGTLSLYYLAQQLYASGLMVMTKALTVPAIPQLALRAREGDWEGFRAVNRRRAVLLVAASSLVFALVVAAGRPALELVFGHGEFSLDRIQRLWWLLLALAGVWIGSALGQVASTSFYAKGDTRTPMRIGIVGFSIAILLKLVCFFRFGIFGLAIAASLYYMLNAIVLSAALQRSVRRASTERSAGAFARR